MRRAAKYQAGVVAYKLLLALDAGTETVRSRLKSNDALGSKASGKVTRRCRSKHGSARLAASCCRPCVNMSGVEGNSWTHSSHQLYYSV